jgi:hypothetical protein
MLVDSDTLVFVTFPRILNSRTLCSFLSLPSLFASYASAAPPIFTRWDFADGERLNDLLGRTQDKEGLPLREVALRKHQQVLGFDQSCQRAIGDGDAPNAMADTQRDWLVKLGEERDLLDAIRLAGPFIMRSQGKS